MREADRRETLIRADEAVPDGSWPAAFASLENSPDFVLPVSAVSVRPNRWAPSTRKESVVPVATMEMLWVTPTGRAKA